MTSRGDILGFRGFRGHGGTPVLIFVLSSICHISFRLTLRETLLTYIALCGTMHNDYC
jgi:hypothetical protein